ncbi:hypothetical protein [Legionella sainthelensi]|uniref:non-homologous end-joining DNA ligase LigD n=1 Tax=Legionella sainthelensi TaxID=28087 RepID=UPI0034D95DCC
MIICVINAAQPLLVLTQQEQRIHAPVAVPISWDELTNDKRDSEFTLKTLPNRLKFLREDPWEDYWRIKQSLRLDKLK